MFETRNKLKRRKTCKDATTVHNAETEAGEKKAEDTKKCSSRSDGIIITREHHPQCEKNCVPNIKLAPIFLRTTQQNSSAAAKDDIIITREHHPQYENNCVPNIKLAPVFLRTTIQKNSSAAKRTDRGPVLHRSSGTTAQTRHHEVTEEPPTTTTTTSSRMVIEGKGPSLSSWKGSELSVSAQNSCLEEMTEANPSFPLRRVFLALKKKHRDGLRDIAQAGDPLDHIGEKRKQPRESDASDNNALKRQQSSVVSKEGSATGHCPSPPEYNDPGVVQPRRGRLSRTYRLKQQGEKTCQDVKDEPKPNLTSQTESSSVVFEAGSSLQRNSIIEDMLWTERYSPQHSNEVIDNSSSVKKLHSWLKKWKLRADCEWKKELEMKRDESSNESWDCGDFQGEAGFEEKREQLCTTMLITGPPGIGKTSSVYACSQELGFKVFEVNSSSQRSGHNVLSQLKEAVQSHLVETSGKDALKPAYLNIYNTTNVSTTKHDTSSGKNTLSAKHVISTSKRRGQKIVKSCCKRKPSPATIMLANFFKMKAKADQLHSGVLSEKPANDISSAPGNELKNWSTVTERKKMATSLILFEEVDVIFDDDIGFLTAVKTFMRNTKRPVILTTSDPLFRERFDGHFEVTIYKTPSLVNVCSYLRLVCLAENVRTELGDVTNLLRLSRGRGDIRSCLLQLQFWVHSGGQLAPQGESLQKDPTRTLFSNTSEVEDISDNPHLPPCDVGCTASMLGFQAETRRSLLTLLKTNPDMNKLLNILAESWRRGVPLLYSNMELLLPLTSAQGSSTCADDVTSSGLQSDRTAPARQPQNQQLVEVIDLTGTTSVKSVRNFSRLGRRKYMPTAIDDRSSSSVAAKTRTTLPSLMGAQYRATCSNDKPKTEDSVTKLATHCLDALIDFIDHMSYLDSTVPTEESHVSGPFRSAEFVWTGAEIRDGLLDEMREGDSGRCAQEERTLEIQAALEGLAFQTCWRKVSEVWTKVQAYRRGLGDKEWQRLVERFTIPVPFHRQSFHFSSTFSCDPSAAQRRYELSKKVLCSPFFSILGNRRAATVEYMPMLRSICRSERAEQQRQPPGRFVYYLSDIGLGLSKSTIQLLSEDFP